MSSMWPEEYERVPIYHGEVDEVNHRDSETVE